MTQEALKLALGQLQAGFVGNAMQILREALAKPDFWEGYVPEPVKPSPVPWSQALEDVWAEQPAQQEPVCGWKREDDDHMPDTWRSDCGVLWTFSDGSPVDNDMKYCLSCGAKLKEKNT